jgi:hypothetical protein
VRHTQACIDMAVHCGAQHIVIEPFPFTQTVMQISLAELAVDALREGCINETLGAYAVREVLNSAPDPAVRQTLQTLAEDETRHAALAYRIVAWALKVGGDEVRAAVLSALQAPCDRLNTAELALRAGVTSELSGLQVQGLQRVVQPALRVLLAA